MKKTIVIIGAHSALAKDVLPVLAIDNKILTAGRDECDIRWDVTSPITLPAGIDCVINFAAAFGGAGDEEILTAQKTNSEGMLNICIAAKHAGVKHIVGISSIFALLDETSPHYSIYALTKRHADELARLYCSLNKIALTILRPSQIYGDSDSFAKNQPFFYEIMNKAESGQDITIYGSHDALRNYIHSSDLAEVISRVVADKIEGMYTCAAPTDVTLSQIVKSAQQIFNKGGHLSFDKDKPDTYDNIFAKDMSIYEKVGYYPKVSLDQGISRLKEHRERG